MTLTLIPDPNPSGADGVRRGWGWREGGDVRREDTQAESKGAVAGGTLCYSPEVGSLEPLIGSVRLGLGLGFGLGFGLGLGLGLWARARARARFG